VLDSSVTLAWVYQDETTETVRSVFEDLSVGGAWVPALWRLEVANVLEMGVRPVATTPRSATPRS
jgi:hypothetical protein